MKCYLFWIALLLLAEPGLTGSHAIAQNTGRVRISVDKNNSSFHCDLAPYKLLSSEVPANLNRYFGLGADHTFKVVTEVRDELGFLHTAYQQYYKNIPVDGQLILLHATDGKALSINGQVALISALNTSPKLDAAQAQRMLVSSQSIDPRVIDSPGSLVIRKTGMDYKLLYKVHLRSRKDWLNEDVYIDAFTGVVADRVSRICNYDVTTTAETYYRGSKSIVVNGDSAGYILLDSARAIHTLNGYKLLQAYLSGNQSIPADYTSATIPWPQQLVLDTFRVTNSGYLVPSVGSTWGLTVFSGSDSICWTIQRTGTTPVVFGGINVPVGDSLLHSARIDFNNTSVVVALNANVPGTYSWTAINGCSGTFAIVQKANPAVDVHWGLEQTYDFYRDVFGRMGPNNHNAKVLALFNLSPNLLNSGTISQDTSITIGLGDGLVMGPVATLDIMAHEYTHLVIDYNGHGGLQYTGESGALNESFADIFAIGAAFHVDPQQANWVLGDSVLLVPPFYHRSMSNPNSGFAQQPDTYHGSHWHDVALPDDHGGVHTNSGVQNFWFYLLCNGGSGINDLGNNYQVAGIGMEKALKIAYRNLIYYLMPAAQFIDSYHGSLQAAADIYGQNAPEYNSVKQAWYAVGIDTLSSPINVPEQPALVNNVKIYPNPASGSVTIESGADIQLSVLNAVGSVAISTMIRKGSNTLSVASLRSGVYFVWLERNGQKLVRKLVIR